MEKRGTVPVDPNSHPHSPTTLPRPRLHRLQVFLIRNSSWFYFFIFFDWHKHGIESGVFLAVVLPLFWFFYASRGMTRSARSWFLRPFVVASCQDWEIVALFSSVAKINVFCFRFVQHFVVWLLRTLFETSWKKLNCFARCERWLLLSWCKALGYFHLPEKMISMFSFAVFLLFLLLFLNY